MDVLEHTVETGPPRVVLSGRQTIEIVRASDAGAVFGFSP